MGLFSGLFTTYKDIKQQEKEMYGMANYLITNQGAAALGAYNVPTTAGGVYLNTSINGTIYTTNPNGYATYQTILGAGQAQVQQFQYNTLPTNAIPAPSGSKITVTMVDASGKHVTMEVDISYAQMLAEISYQHQYSPHYQVAQRAKMVDGDFSMDELELAETLIAEIEVGQSKKGTKEKAEMSAL